MKKAFLIFFILLSISLVTAVPSIPLIVQGTVKINDKDAPVGTIITVEADNEGIAAFTLEQKGSYAFVINEKQGIKDKEIKFFVDGIDTLQTTTWESGKVVNIGLNNKENNKITGNVVANTENITENKEKKGVLLPITVLSLIIILLIVVFVLIKKFL